jgi:hypothetical protein
MAQGTHSETATIAGMTFSRTVSATADAGTTYGDASAPIALAVATPTLTYTEGAGETGSGTLTAGHGLTTGIYDVYWAAGMRYGTTVVISTNDISSFTDTAWAGGDSLPASATQLYLCKNADLNIALDGDLAEMVGILADVRAHITFHDVSNNVIREVDLQADEPDLWDSENVVNPYTGAVITHAHYSQATIVAGTLKIAVLQDATP